MARGPERPSVHDLRRGAPGAGRRGGTGALPPRVSDHPRMDTLPDVELLDHSANPRRLSELVGGDPAVLQTYRGPWCPKE